MRWKIDECPDAYGNWTLREDDGTEHGNTETCIATVYGGIWEQELIEAAPRLKEECDRLSERVRILREALSGVLDSSEDGGDMNDIDWSGIRAALEATKEGA